MLPSLRLRRVRAVATPTATIVEIRTTTTASSAINNETPGAHAITRARAAEVAVKGAGVGATTTTTIAASTTIIIKQEAMLEAGADTKAITKDAMVVADITKISSKIFIIILRPLSEA